MTETIIPIRVSLEEVRQEIWEADLLLIRNRTGSRCRAAKAAWWDGDLFALEVRKYGGLIVTPMDRIVRKYPGRIDVFEVNPQNRWEEYDRQKATRYLRRWTTPAQNARLALVETLCSVLLPRWLHPDKRIVFGAQAVAMADRHGGGVDPVPAISEERCADPIDLKYSPLYRYRYTLK